MDEITLEVWAKEEAERLATFVAEWKEKAMDEPKQYPSTLAPGNWDEQYLTFNGHFT